MVVVVVVAAEEVAAVMAAAPVVADHLLVVDMEDGTLLLVVGVLLLAGEGTHLRLVAEGNLLATAAVLLPGAPPRAVAAGARGAAADRSEESCNFFSQACCVRSMKYAV